jgi:2-dehydropantoate 2-reductase
MQASPTYRNSAKHPRVAVVGAGAMGSIFGTAFGDAGAETVFIDSSTPLVDRLREHGLTIVGADGERVTRVSVTTDPGPIGVVDLALFLVKCYQTESAAKLASPLVGPRTIVASFQNGWGNGEVLARSFPAEQMVVGVTYDSGTVLEPGRVAHTYRAETFIGPYVGESLDRARWIADLLSAAGFRVTATPAVRAAIWEKLVMTSATLPTSALTGLTSGALGEPGPMLDLVDGLALETLETAHSAGYELTAAKQLENIRLALVGEGKASMLQDVECRRQTEIDVINGAVVREAEVHHVAVPLNRAMVALVKAWERAHGLT